LWPSWYRPSSRSLQLLGVERLHRLQLVPAISIRRQFVGDGRRSISGGLPAAEQVRQRGAESPTAEAVDDEVDRRVGNDERIRENVYFVTKPKQHINAVPVMARLCPIHTADADVTQLSS